MGKRRRAREMAIQMLYQQELGGSPLSEVFSSFELGGYPADREESPPARRTRAGPIS